MPLPEEQGLEAVGITVAFATSAFTCKIVDVDGPELSRSEIETTHQTSEEYWRNYIPSKLKNGGELSLKIHFAPDATPPIDGAPETVTVTWPVPEGKLVGATWSWNRSFMTKFKASGQLGQLMTADITVKFQGKLTIVPAS